MKKTDREEDLEFSRNTYKELIERGEKYLEGIEQIAEETGAPRAYEVLSAMMKNLADMTDKLSALHKTSKEIDTIEKELREDEENFSSNTPFTTSMSTAEMQKTLLVEAKTPGKLN